jgi:protein-L-isoaspartate(D-aspartate) O-methyltransferase
MNMNLESARLQMVEQQVRAWSVLDLRVLETMMEVHRETFVPAEFSAIAFADAAIPLPCGQSMLPPKVHGRMLQALDLQPDDAVLEVGTGSGFLAACMARLAARVRSIEIYPQLAESARKNLLAAAVNNVGVDVEDGLQLAEENHYDAIAVTGSLAMYDERFQRALKIGGRLFIVVGQAPVMEAWKITRTGEREWTRETLFETVIEPLVNSLRPSPFVF